MIKWQTQPFSTSKVYKFKYSSNSNKITEIKYFPSSVTFNCGLFFNESVEFSVITLCVLERNTLGKRFFHMTVTPC